MGTFTSYQQLYEHSWEQFEGYLRGLKDASSPLLLDLSESYWNQKPRLFIVGQETKEWYNEVLQNTKGPQAIASLMDKYKKFRFRLDRPRPGVFWEFVRDVEQKLGISPGSIAWSNVNKVDIGKKRPPCPVRSKIRELFPVLDWEIKLAKPDILLFLTGPMYDSYLKRLFPGLQFDDSHDLGIITAPIPELPRLTFRTNHPRVLRLRRLWDGSLDTLARRCLN